MPIITHWKIRRSGKGLVIEGAVDGKPGKITCSEVAFYDPRICALKDGAEIAELKAQATRKVVP